MKIATVDLETYWAVGHSPDQDVTYRILYAP